MTIKEFITKWAISKAALGRKIGMKKSCFSNKMNEHISYAHFTDEEMEEMRLVFKEMAKDLREVVYYNNQNNKP